MSAQTGRVPVCPAERNTAGSPKRVTLIQIDFSILKCAIYYFSSLNIQNEIIFVSEGFFDASVDSW